MKEDLINLLPKQLHVPLRYYYSKSRGRLEPEITYLRDLVGEGKRAIDVGASRGAYTYALSRLCNVVEAFEPQKWAYEAISAFKASNINCHNVGLSNYNGFLELNVPILDGKVRDGLASFRKMSGEQKSLLVPIKKLDEYNFKDVSFMKIDVEGYESEVIEGAVNTIATNKPAILIEIEQRHLTNKSIHSVFEQVLDMGYEGSFLSNNSFYPIKQFSYAQHQEACLEEIIRTGRCKNYINNFIFKPQ